MEQTCYASRHGDEFFNDPEDVIQDFLEYADDGLEFPHVLEIREGIGKCKPFSRYVSRYGLDTIFESAQESAGEEVGDSSDGWLEEVTQEQRRELLALLDEWATKHGHQPTFWEIEKTRPVSVRVLNWGGDYEWIGDEGGVRNE